jgi:hypothetical protein
MSRPKPTPRKPQRVMLAESGCFMSVASPIGDFVSLHELPLPRRLGQSELAVAICLAIYQKIVRVDAHITMGHLPFRTVRATLTAHGS